MSGINWLASYPKSGNTWVRVFLENYLDEGLEPIGINSLPSGSLAYQRELLDEWLGVETAELTSEVVDRYRPKYYESLGASSSFQLLKTHECFRTNREGESVFSSKSTAGVILLVRDPLDVVVSLAHFMRISLNEAIQMMANRSMTLSPDTRELYNLIPQLVGSWSDHAESWIEAGVRLHIVRFEDLLGTPHEHFKAMVTFLKLPIDQGKLERSIAAASFDRLENQETQEGFRELNTGAPKFFRKGQQGGGKKVLSRSQINLIQDNHQKLMRRFGYLPV